MTPEPLLAMRELHKSLTSAKMSSWSRTFQEAPVAPEPCGPPPSSLVQGSAPGPPVACPGLCEVVPGPPWHTWTPHNNTWHAPIPTRSLALLSIRKPLPLPPGPMPNLQ